MNRYRAIPIRMTIYEVNYQLIMQYRGVAMHPEVDQAIEEIVNEAVTLSDNEMIADINMDNVDISDSIKKQGKKSRSRAELT